MRYVALLVTLLLVAPSVGADERTEAERLLDSKDVRIRARIEPVGTIYVGQRARLEIDLMTTTYFTGAPTLGEPDIAHAIVRRESDFAVNATTRLDEKTYATQTWAFVIYPQKTGTFEVAAVDVTLRVAGEDRTTVAVAVTTPHLSFEATVPTGAEGLAFVLSTPRFALAQEIDRELQNLKVGDAFRRTVTMTVDDAPGMLIPPLPAVVLDGVAAYPDSPRVDDQQNRGAITGTRVESISYVFERAGTYRFPEVSVSWWNLDDEVLEAAVLPAMDLSVAANPDIAAGPLAEPESSTSIALEEPSDKPPWGALLIGAFAALSVWHLYRRYGDDVRAWAATRRRERAESEAAWFRRLEAACRANDPRAAMRGLVAWLERRAGPRQNASAMAFAQEAGDPALLREVGALEARLFGATDESGPWSGEGLLNAVSRARKRAAVAAAVPPAALQLNPRHS